MKLAVQNKRGGDVPSLLIFTIMKWKVKKKLIFGLWFYITYSNSFSKYEMWTVFYKESMVFKFYLSYFHLCIYPDNLSSIKIKLSKMRKLILITAIAASIVLLQSCSPYSYTVCSNKINCTAWTR